MPSGGARNRSGPAPEFDALKRERDARTWTRLPKECTRPAPDWPLEVPDPIVDELAMWERLWRQPQAHIWHADRSVDQVAIYVRTFIESAGLDAPAQRRILAKQLGDGLLLSTAALHSAKYVITETAEADMLQQIKAQAAPAAAAPPRPGPRGGRSARDRMGVTVIEGGAAPATEPENDDEEGDVE